MKDWAFAYFVNHYNISRHVVPTGHLHTDLSENAQKVYWHNDNVGHVKHERLHAWDDGSELYGRERGNCRYVNKKCNAKSGSCHYMDEESMHRLSEKVKQSFPDKYRLLSPTVVNS